MDNEFLDRAKIEISKGRLPLWLEKEEVIFLANEWRKIPERIDENSKKFWSQIAFKSKSVLHKNEIEYDTIFPKDNEKYK